MKLFHVVLCALACVGVSASEDIPDYATIYKKHLQFPPCVNEYFGVFESTQDGCFQIDAGLIWRPPSTGDMSQPLALKYCSTVDRLAGRKGQNQGWRVPTLEELDSLYSDLEFIAKSSGLEVEKYAADGMGILPFDLSPPMWIEGVEKKSGYHDGGVSAGNRLSVDFSRTYSIAKGEIVSTGPNEAMGGKLMVEVNSNFTYLPLTATLDARALCVRTATDGEEPPLAKEEEEAGESSEIPSPRMNRGSLK